MLSWAQRKGARYAYYWTTGVAMMGQSYVTW